MNLHPVNLTVNGSLERLDVPANRTLLEMLRDELKAKIRMAEVVERKPPAPVKKKPVDERAKVAAVAAVIIGSIIWIASR